MIENIQRIFYSLNKITGYNKYRKVDGIIECCCFSGLRAFELAC